jgi:DNA-binding beta-propeller fold protein YncE
MENPMNKYVSAVAVTVLAAAAVSAANAQSVVATVTLPNLPEGVAVNPLTNRVYVAVPNFGAQPFDYVTVINGKTNTIVKNIEIPPVALAIADDPFLASAYVGGSFDDGSGVQHNEIAVVSTSANKLVKTISVSTTPGDGIEGLSVNPVTSRLYVANGSDNEIDVVKLAGAHANTIVAKIALPGEPGGVAVNPLTNQVYAALFDGNVTVIDGATNTVTTTTPVGTSNAGVAVDYFTGNVFATNQGDGSTQASTVGVLNAAGTFITNVGVGAVPIGIDVDQLTGLVFVANTQDGTVSVINGSTKTTSTGCAPNTVCATLPVSGLYVASDFVTGKVYVTSPTDPSLTVISEK